MRSEGISGTPWKCRGSAVEVPWKCRGSAVEVVLTGLFATLARLREIKARTREVSGRRRTFTGARIDHGILHSRWSHAKPPRAQRGTCLNQISDYQRGLAVSPPVRLSSFPIPAAIETLNASGLPGCVFGGSCVLRELVGRRGSRPYRLLCDLGASA
jgi:hypothetical protein